MGVAMAEMWTSEANGGNTMPAGHAFDVAFDADDDAPDDVGFINAKGSTISGVGTSSLNRIFLPPAQPLDGFLSKLYINAGEIQAASSSSSSPRPRR